MKIGEKDKEKERIALIDRWETEKGKEKREQILKCLQENLPLENVVEKVNGLYDLRGITLAKYQLNSGYLYNKLVNYIEINPYDFIGVDFSYADLSKIDFKHSDFKNVKFHTMTNMRGCSTPGSYYDCKFTQSELSGFIMGKDGSKFQNVEFDQCNLQNIHVICPDFIDCVFRKCNLKRVRFNDTSFINVKFIGRLAECFFYCEPLRYPDKGDNLMIIDFSESILDDVVFGDECKFEHVIIPKDGNHFLIKDTKRAAEYAAKKLEQTTDEDEIKYLKKFIFFYDDNQYGKKEYGRMDIINTKFMAKLTRKSEKTRNLEEYSKKFIEEVVKMEMTKTEE